MSNVFEFPGRIILPDVPENDDTALRADIRRRCAAVLAVMGTSPTDDDTARCIYQLKKAIASIECIRVMRILP